MRTTRHTHAIRDSRDLSNVPDSSIDLIVTSPPYPMIEMWDDQFGAADPAIARAIQDGDGVAAFESMHSLLDAVWSECVRVTRAGGFICINIGDTTRTVGDRFRLYPNHTRITEAFRKLGVDPLPCVHWEKPTNAPNKFMGSGMLPAGAYVTLEHEYILVFRRGGKRIFATEEERRRRRESAFFWEERNQWFSDVWTLKGKRQAMTPTDPRARSGAFPVDLALRLIRMYSLKADRILDPFSGTGTTAVAAAIAGRSSVSCEVDGEFEAVWRNRVVSETAEANRLTVDRVAGHMASVEARSLEGKELRYVNEIHGFPVVTRQERELTIDFVQRLEVSQSEIIVSYETAGTDLETPPPIEVISPESSGSRG